MPTAGKGGAGEEEAQGWGREVGGGVGGRWGESTQCPVEQQVP